MSAIGLYHPGSSVLHRLPAGAKLLGMLAAIVGVLLLRAPWQLAVAAAVVAAGYAAARIPARLAWAQLKPLRWVVAAVGTVQLIVSGLHPAVMVCGGLLISVAVAALVTLTTRVTALLDLTQRLLRPARRAGVDPDRVGLVLALTIRCIPLLVAIVQTVSEARRARGLGFSIRALAAPVMVRALRSADGLGEALVARGFDDGGDVDGSRAS